MNKIPSMEVGKFTVYNNGDKTASVYREGKFISAIEWCTASSDLIYKMSNEIGDLEVEIAKLKSDNAKLIEALEFYAQTSIWFSTDSLVSRPVFYDSTDQTQDPINRRWYGGRLARQVLKEIKG